MRRLLRGAPITQAAVILAHPCDDSFNRAIAERARAALADAGAEVELVDLHAIGFRAAMSGAERMAYHTEEPILDAQVAELADLVRRCDALVFVYPTWWSGLPAMMKGFLDRVLVPGVAFGFDGSGKVVPGMRHVRHLVGISTYGSPRSYVAAVNDNGRRMITRALRMSCGLRTRTTWLGLYALDTASEDERRAFLRRVDETLRHRALGGGRDGASAAERAGTGAEA